MAKEIRIAVAGEGGQGVQSIAQILMEAAALAGREALYIPNFGIEQRGGVSIAFVQVGDEHIRAPKFKTGDIVVALSDRAVRRIKMHVGPETTFIYDASIEGVEDDLPENAKQVLAIPATKVAGEEFHPRVFNVVIMGAVIQATGVVPTDMVKQALEKQLGKKFENNPQLREMNFNALERGMQLVEKAVVEEG